MWCNAYIGIPFEEAHCWQLTGRVQREVFGVDVPDTETNPDDFATNSTIIQDTTATWRSDWVQVNEPKEGDIVCFKLMGEVCHVGVMVSHYQFLHTMRKIGACVERIDTSVWKQRVESFWRHRKWQQS